MAVLYTAKEVNAGIVSSWANELQLLRSNHITPTLATVRIGDSGADVSYELGATKRLKALELGVKNVVFKADAPEELVISKLHELSNTPRIHGILLFQPLPAQYDEEKVKAAIDPEKDVDCATVNNLGAVLAGRAECYPYCAPAAVMEVLDHYHIDLEGKYAVIVGSGLVVGKPLSMMLVDRFATVSICNIYTKDTPAIARKADILISATGVPGLITADYVREGQIVIDVGTCYKDGKLYGDVDMATVEPIVYAVTPTPGGISGITTTVLAKHVIHSAKRLYEQSLQNKPIVR